MVEVGRIVQKVIKEEEDDLVNDKLEGINKAIGKIRLILWKIVRGRVIIRKRDLNEIRRGSGKEGRASSGRRRARN